MLKENNSLRLLSKIIINQMNIYKVNKMFQLEKHMRSHNLSAHPWHVVTIKGDMFT